MLVKVIAAASVPTGASANPLSMSQGSFAPVSLVPYVVGPLPQPFQLYSLGPGDGLDLKFQVQTAAVALRPWAWVPTVKVDSTAAVTGGGVWVPIGYDSVSGPSPSTANPASLNGTAWGRFQDADAGMRYWIVVVESGSAANVLWADLTVVRRSVVTT